MPSFFTEKNILRSILCFCLFFGLNGIAVSVENWPGYRGPDDRGRAADSHPPIKWSESENVAWKTPLPGKGCSTPAVWGDRVWLTTATEDGKELSVIALDKNTGEIVLNKMLHKVEKPQTCHPLNSYATPSPVVEEGRVYLSYGAPYNACIDSASGEIVWDRDDLVCHHTVGAASSPMLHGNLMIVHFDGREEQYILAFDKKTGETVWKTDRTVKFDDIDPKTDKPKEDGEYRKAFSAPIVEQLDGRPVLVSLASMALYGYEPSTGKELWRIETPGSYSGVMRPVSEPGAIYCRIGCIEGLWAIRPRGEGVLDEKDCVSWKYKKTVPFIPSILLVDGRIFMTDDNGVVVCLDAKTGKELWKERIGGNFHSSPVYAGGNIYFCDQDGKTTVIEAGPKYKLLAENKLDDGIQACPAVSGDALYLRTKSAIYCIKQ
jgi:outer membrane protein assembly factor BamB